MASTRRNILAGPSKWNLMLSLFERKECEFQLEGLPKPLKVVVTKVEQEDGSCESWQFAGHAAGIKICRGYFRTDRRSGFVQLET